MDRSRNPAGLDLEVHPLEPARVPDFDTVHADASGCGWCRCVAWWVPNWSGWGERSAEENRTLRDRLFHEGQYDGYLLYRKKEPVGWMQVGQVGRLDKLWKSYRLDELEVTPRDPAVSCVLLLPAVRGEGLLHRFLDGVIRHLEARGPGNPPVAERLLAFPLRGQHPADDVWTGPDAVFAAAGFQTLREDPVRPVLARSLSLPGAQTIRSAPRDRSGTGDSPAVHFQCAEVSAPDREVADTLPRVVVFDLGGVLVDNAGIERLLDWAPHLSADELWARWLASPSVRDFEAGRTGPGEFVRALATEFSLAAEPEAIQQEITAWIRGFFTGAAELLAELRPQVRLACLSNTNQMHWDRMLEEIDLYAAFHHRFLSFRTGRLKPDAEAFTHLVSALAPYTSDQPERILFLDDHPNNVVAALREGIDARRTIGIDAARVELKRCGFRLGSAPEM